VSASTSDLILDTTLEESGLVSRAKAGDAEVWASWYDQYCPLLFRYAHARLGNQQDAEDVAAQVFLEALKSIHRFKYQGRPVLAWLYGIAHNLVASKLRRLKKTPQTPVAEAEASNDSSLEALELRQAMTRLTRDQRETIMLRFLVGLSTAEVAILLGKKPATVYSLQAKAIAALKRQLA
jgi:RNA polymerase sigma-70 factor, ECF subfamily